MKKKFSWKNLENLLILRLESILLLIQPIIKSCKSTKRFFSLYSSYKIHLIFQEKVFGLFLVLIRLPLFIVILIWTILFEKIIIPLVFLYFSLISNKFKLFVASFQRYLLILNNRICFRTMLFLLGYLKLEDLGKKPPRMGSGTLILSLQNSPIDYFLLNYLCSPVYARMLIASGENKSIYFSQSYSNIVKYLYDPMSFSIKQEENIKEKNIKELVLWCEKQKKGPLVLFFEVLQ